MFTKNLNKILLVGVTLVGCNMNSNCTSLMDQDAFPQTFSPRLIETLPHISQKELISSTLLCLANPTFLESFVDNLSPKDRTGFFSMAKNAQNKIDEEIDKYDHSTSGDKHHQISNSVANNYGSSPESSLQYLLEDAIKAFQKTLDIISNTGKLSEVGDLPVLNKAMLLDLTNKLLKRGKSTFAELNEVLKKENLIPLTFNDASLTINRGYQFGQNYKKYTESNDPWPLIHLMHCFFISKCYEILGIASPLSIENLQILIKNIVDNSEGNSLLFQLAEMLETVMAQ